MIYRKIAEFEKDFKKIKKRFASIDSDFENMKKYVLEMYYVKNVPTTAIVEIEGFCGNEYTSNKIRKFSCKAMKGKGSQSGIRVIYVYESITQEITFIELYFKGDKPNEDRVRLKNFLKGLEIE